MRSSRPMRKPIVPRGPRSAPPRRGARARRRRSHSAARSTRSRRPGCSSPASVLRKTIRSPVTAFSIMSPACSFVSPRSDDERDDRRARLGSAYEALSDDNFSGEGMKRHDFRILGPLEVRAGDDLLELGGPRQRTLLEFLLLNRNRVVSSERIVDAVWGAGSACQRAERVAGGRARRPQGPGRRAGCDAGCGLPARARARRARSRALPRPRRTSARGASRGRGRDAARGAGRSTADLSSRTSTSFHSSPPSAGMSRSFAWRRSNGESTQTWLSLEKTSSLESCTPSSPRTRTASACRGS